MIFWESFEAFVINSEIILVFREFWKNSSYFFLVVGDIFGNFRESYCFFNLDIIFFVFVEKDLFLLEDKLRDFSILFFERNSPTFIMLFISFSLLLLRRFKGLLFKVLLKSNFWFGILLSVRFLFLLGEIVIFILFILLIIFLFLTTVCLILNLFISFLSVFTSIFSELILLLLFSILLFKFIFFLLYNKDELSELLFELVFVLFSVYKFILLILLLLSFLTFICFNFLLLLLLLFKETSFISFSLFIKSPLFFIISFFLGILDEALTLIYFLELIGEFIKLFFNKLNSFSPKGFSCKLILKLLL